MTDSLSSRGNGGVLPAGTLPKINLGDTPTVLKILAIEPENGEGVASENDMIAVQYPDGFVKHHQIKELDVVDLLSKIKNTLMGKYNIASFSFDTIPALAVGAEINLLEVK